jgi:chromosome segregation ATPase
MEENQDQFKSELSGVTEKVNEMNKSFDSMIDSHEEIKNNLDGECKKVDEVLVDLVDSVDEILNELDDVRDTANAAFSKTEELEESIMDIASDIEKSKLVQESFEDRIDIVRDLRVSIEILEESQREETNKNIAMMDLGMKG